MFVCMTPFVSVPGIESNVMMCVLSRSMASLVVGVMVSMRLSQILCMFFLLLFAITEQRGGGARHKCLCA